MAVDMFLKLDGIKGESADHKHKEEIDVLAFSWGMSQAGTAHMGGGAGAGKVSVQDLTVTKFIDKASPTLAFHCANGKHIPKATLTVRKAGEHPLEYLVLDLTDLLVSHVAPGGSQGDDRLTESVSLNFAKFEYKYKEQKQDGSGGPEVRVGWNIRENTSA
jgi:type VI secretion system secreted protein Hcp